ncbi:MAG: carboxypeptidase-like regulatory domain-containing protein, partial [Cytophagales bacterium]|nr:carboxypeptidase-like regulatory domain-containing protein [Cytophagales bacterium]
MRKLLLSFVLVAFGCGLSWAQERTVTGTVTASSDGTPLPGVSVSIKGTTRGNVTDGQGRYSLAAPDNATLVFSFVGFISQEVAVGGRSSINVALQSDVSELSEIVITGYGTQNKREVSGSVATVKGSTISQMPMASFDQTLQGMAPGILVQANSGQPGSAASILIRGRGSILGNTDPLFIMDGVEISSTDFSTLNPGDFESLTVLKDAASTSIYGS